MKKPKFIIKYGNGGIQKCYSRKDIGDFLAYLALNYPLWAKSLCIEAVE